MADTIQPVSETPRDRDLGQPSSADAALRPRGAGRRAMRRRACPLRSAIPAANVGRARVQRCAWTNMPRGGHFAALEAPELLAGDVKQFFGDRANE